ncbi:MAG: hypothetical protein OXJ37_00815 [Bryobacterales bacterium]|nr:hypothetical protein [Bryobacterales bacterium]MDE0260931.1 hypothetical protein [Bryobacterales bacterium]MDE0624575.1 hypothetical protein [Bryobacterales bacterium]
MAFCAFGAAGSFRSVPFESSDLSVAADSFAAFLGVDLALVSAGVFAVAATALAAAALTVVLVPEDAFWPDAVVFFAVDLSSGGALAALLEDFGEAARFLAAAFGAAVDGRLAPVLPAAACPALGDFLAEGFFAAAFLAEAFAALLPAPVPATPGSALAVDFSAPSVPALPASLAIGGLVDACG